MAKDKNAVAKRRGNSKKRYYDSYPLIIGPRNKARRAKRHAKMLAAHKVKKMRVPRGSARAADRVGISGR